MVMMEKPSPIQVGREFVRQYYTLLNKAPALLHRFYNVNSSYVHGGKYVEGQPEEPIIGQSEIYHKIESLNFNDCHTKIRQVDALSTLSNGVVVQVTGELSNRGQPLRRFMQTFVLGPQGDNPFKFYVRNDIFRYQDEIFSESNGEASEDEEQASPEVDEVPTVSAKEPEVNDVEPPEALEAVSSYQENLYQPSMTNHTIDQQPPTLTNGLEQTPDTIELDQNSSSTQAIEHSDPPESDHRTPTPTAFTQTPESELTETNLAPEEPIEIAKEPEIPEPKAPSKPFSWADMASKNTPAPKTSVMQGTVVKVNRTPELQSDISNSEPAPRQQRAPRNAPRRDDERSGGFGDRTGFGDRPGGFGDRSDRRGLGRDSIRYPDNQQIFVGNLPYEIDEADLRDHFSSFGQVVEVKINHSQTNNPSFGFVIFKDPKSVENVLRVMPTQYKNQHRINIEEKKQRNNRESTRRGGEPRRSGMGESRGGRRGPPPPNMRRDRQGSREGVRPSGPRR